MKEREILTRCASEDEEFRVTKKSRAGVHSSVGKCCLAGTDPWV